MKQTFDLSLRVNLNYNYNKHFPPVYLCVFRTFRTPEAIEREREEATWKTTKVRKINLNRPLVVHCNQLFFQVKEELRLVHEAYQFFRFRNKSK